MRIIVFSIFLLIFTSLFASKEEFQHKYKKELNLIEKNTKLDKDILITVFKIESDFSNSLSTIGSNGLIHRGLGQLSKSACEHVLNYYKIDYIEYEKITKNPSLNIYFSGLYLNLLYTELKLKYGLNKEKTLILTLMAYNWGIGAVTRYVEKNSYFKDKNISLKLYYKKIQNDSKIPFETRNYVKKFFKYYSN